MDRRNMLRSAAAIAAAPLLYKNPFAEFSLSERQGNSATEIRKFGDERDWFFSKRFGMFIHWGVYAIPGWHEQHQWRARVPRAEYIKLADQWNPVKFNPDKWLDLMEISGMQYITVTTKHHDGFCLWDTKLTRFNTMNTPYGQDIIGKLADACHRRSVPLCLYYSIADWNHPSYPNKGRHHELAGPEQGDKPDWDAYVEFLRGQVKELCTNYGRIHGFWWDMNVPEHKDPSINELIRSLQPAAVINNRGFDEGDFGTPERDFDSAEAESRMLSRPTEACQSVGMESWGYRSDEDFYTTGHLVRSIDKYLARGANYLLNVGPAPDGTIPKESAAILKKIGKWYNKVKESYENVSLAPDLIASRDVLVTRRGNIIYLHFPKGITGTGFKLKPLDRLPVSASLLNNGKPVKCSVTMAPSDHSEQKKYLRLAGLPSGIMADTAMIIKLEFEGTVI